MVASVLAPSSGVGSDVAVAQTADELCDAGSVAQFTDVGVGDYGAEYVLCMRVLGLSVGRGDGGYGPDAELTRAQMASFLVRLWRDVLGRVCPDGVGVPFVDVAGNTHETNIRCLFGLGITKGTTASTYGPGEKLKASQISRFLLRVFDKTGGVCEGSDVELDRALECLLGLGVIPSKAEGAGGGSVSRAQMAVYMVGLWHNIVGRGAAPLPPGKPAGSRDDDDRVTVPVRVDRVDLDHVDPADVSVSLGLETPVGVGGDLAGTAEATGQAVATDGQGRPQGLSVVAKGDTAVDIHIDYNTTAAALVLQTPGLATTDPMITLGLVVLLAGLDEVGVLADQLQTDAASNGADYLVGLSPRAQQALADTVVALTAAVEDLAAGTAAAGSAEFGPAGSVSVGGPVAGVGLAAGTGQPTTGWATRDGLVAAAGDCEPVWNEADGVLGTWDPLGRGIAQNDGICLDGSITSLFGENDSWWSALVVPVTVNNAGAVTFSEAGEMYFSSKTADFPDLFSEVLWGAAKNALCTGASVPLEVLEWASFGLVDNPLHCDWAKYSETFRLNSGGKIQNADLGPLYSGDDPVKRLAIIKSPFAGNNPYRGQLDVENQRRWTRLERAATTYQAVHLLTPVLGMIVDHGMTKVTKALRARLDTALKAGNDVFLTATSDVTADFAATLTRLIVDKFIDKEDVVDVPVPSRRYDPAEKEDALRTIMSILLPTLEAVLHEATKRAIKSAIPVLGQIMTALDVGIKGGNTAGTWVQAIAQHGYEPLSFYTEGTAAGAGTFGPYKAISVSHSFSCALRTDQTIECWGYGAVDPPEGTFTAISAGWAHACGLRPDGTIECWGYNLYGRASPPEGTFTSVSAGSAYSCGLRPGGTIECWGYNLYGRESAPESTFTSVSAGWTHVCGVHADGTVECWGSDSYGQSTPPEGTFTSVSAGDRFSCGLRPGGTVECWGRNSYGESTPPEGTFTSVSAGGVDASYASTPSAHACGLRPDGTVECWGRNSYGESTPPEGTFTSVSADGIHSCGVRTEGTIECWGRNNYGQSKPPGGSFTFTSVDVCGLRTDGTIECWGGDSRQGVFSPEGSLTAISAGRSHACGLRPDGTIECWGDNRYGQATPPEGAFTSVSAAPSHVCGVRAGGAIECWGDNSYGQATPPEGAFISVSAAGSTDGGHLYRSYSCGLRTGGTVDCWGGPIDEQFEQPEGTFSTISGLCGVRTDGVIICWDYRGSLTGILH